MGFRWSGVQIPPARPTSNPLGTNKLPAIILTHADKRAAVCDRLLDALNPFTTALTWPEAQQRFQALRDSGLNQPGEMENRFGELLGTPLDT